MTWPLFNAAGEMAFDGDGVARLGGNGCESCCPGGDGEPCREFVKCFAQCGGCGTAGYSPWRVDPGGGQVGGEPCDGVTDGLDAGCRCCALAAGEEATIVATRVYDELDATGEVLYRRLRVDGVCTAFVDRVQPILRRFLVETTRTIRVVGTGLPDGLVDVASDVTVTRERASAQTVTGALECRDDLVSFAFNTDATTTDEGVPRRVPLRTLHVGGGGLGPQFGPRALLAAGGCFVPFRDETDGSGVRRELLAAFHSSCGSFGGQRVERTTAPTELATGTNPDDPNETVPGTDVIYTNTALRWTLTRAADCESVPATPVCAVPMVYGTVDCATGEPGPDICAELAAAYAVFGPVVGLGGCCYRVLFDDGVRAGHGAAEGRFYRSCAECRDAARWVLEDCATGERTRAVRASGVRAFEGVFPIVQTLAGDCYRVLFGTFADPAAPLVEVFSAFAGCPACMTNPPAVRATRRCDDGQPGPSVVNIDAGVVVRLGGVCHEVMPDAGDPADVRSVGEVFGSCEDCAPAGDLCFAYRQCSGPVGLVGCRQPIGFYAPPVITYDKSTRPPGDTTLVLAGACSGYLICYTASDDPAEEPIVPPAPTRLAWRSRLVCQTTGEPPACCTPCACGDCLDHPQYFDGRPFDIPFPQQSDQAVEAGGTRGLF